MDLKKQQWLNNVFKETTMAEQWIVKKQQQWLNNGLYRNNNG